MAKIVGNLVGPPNPQMIVDRVLNTDSNNPISNSAVSAHVEDINTALLEIIAIAEDLATPDGNEVRY